MNGIIRFSFNSVITHLKKIITLGEGEGKGNVMLLIRFESFTSTVKDNEPITQAPKVRDIVIF